MIHALHGNLGSPADWDVLHLSDLIAHDLWAFLESDPEIGLVEWGERFATSIEDPYPILLGYSMGGRLALHAMAAAPEKWRGAVIVSAHPGLLLESERDARLEADRNWSRRARELPWLDLLRQWNRQKLFSSDLSEPAPAQTALEPRRESISRAFENWSLGHQQFPGLHLGACHFPVLWITGERDRKFTGLAGELDQVLPDFEHLVIENCRHRVLREKPEALAAAIRDFQKRRL